MAITNMLPQIWSARILAKLEKNLVFAQPGVVNRDYEGDIRADGDRVHIHSFNDLTIGSYTKNSTTITYENLTNTRVTLLIDQSKYFAFKVDDIDTAQMRPELDREVREVKGEIRELIRRVREGGFEPTAANAINRLYQTLLQYIIVERGIYREDDLAQRIRDLSGK